MGPAHHAHLHMIADGSDDYVLAVPRLSFSHQANKAETLSSSAAQAKLAEIVNEAVPRE